MKKEPVEKFDLEAAFKALEEIEVPVTEGIKANRIDLKERFNQKSAHDTLVEDYYNISSNESLEEAQEDREGEVAQAKLARIEKIVDLDADTPEDLLPSYVGKVIIQCPQCMTLFYKNPEDIEHSEENPDVVNINEVCQHCGNTSGYTLIGKVDSVSADEANKYETAETEEAPEEESELDLDFSEPTEEVDAEGTGEGAEETDLDLDLDLTEIPEEEEKKEESLNHSKVEREAEEGSELFTDHKSENLTLNEESSTKNYSVFYKDKCGHQLFTGTKAECDNYVKEHSEDNMVITHGGLEIINLDDAGVDAPALPESLNNSEVQKEAEEGSELKTENESENLTLNEEIDKDLDKKLKAHNDYIEYLKKMLEQEEEALKKTENEEVKAAIQRRIDAFKADLEAALPDALKSEAEPVEEVAETEEAPAEETSVEEVKAEETAEETPVEEALTEVETDQACAVVFADDPDGRQLFVGSKEDCEKRVEANKNDPAARNHGGLKVIEKAKVVTAKESLNNSEVQKEAETGSELKTENESENLSLNESTPAENIAKLDAFEASLPEDLEEKPAEETNPAVEALNDYAETLTECGENKNLKEADFNVSDSEFAQMINSQVFNEDLPTASEVAKIANAIEHAGEDLEETPKDEKKSSEEPVNEFLDGNSLSIDLGGAGGAIASALLADNAGEAKKDGDILEEKVLDENKFTDWLRGIKPVDSAVRKHEINKDFEYFKIIYWTLKDDGEFELVDDSKHIKPFENLDAAKESVKNWFKAPDHENDIAAIYGSKNTDVSLRDRKTASPYNVATASGQDPTRKEYYTLDKGTGKENLKLILVYNYDASTKKMEVKLDRIEEASNELEYERAEKRDEDGEKGEILRTVDPSEITSALIKDDKFQICKADKSFTFPTDYVGYANAITNAKVLSHLAPVYIKGTYAGDGATQVILTYWKDGVEQDKKINNIRLHVLLKNDATKIKEKLKESLIFEGIEELDETAFNEHINSFLTEVYENVKSFETTDCRLTEDKLIVEGKISFNSGAEKLTVFEFLPNYGEGSLFLEGYNKDFSEDKAFTLNYSLTEDKALKAESLGYKYMINESLVEGLK